MSTDQPTLTDYSTDHTPTLHERVLEESGSKYGPSETATASAPKQAPENVCLNCGADIPARISRVVGDNDGCVPACGAPDCREDVLEDHQLRSHHYEDTVRLVLYLLNEKRDAGIDNSAGGRR